jgi:hypothetical protein
VDITQVTVSAGAGQLLGCVSNRDSHVGQLMVTAYKRSSALNYDSRVRSNDVRPMHQRQHSVLLAWKLAHRGLLSDPKSRLEIKQHRQPRGACPACGPRCPLKQTSIVNSATTEARLHAQGILILCSR